MQTVFENQSSEAARSLITVGDTVIFSNTGADAIQKAPIVDDDTGIRCVRVGDMSNKRDFHEWGFTRVEPKIFEQYQLCKDDIIVTRTATLGLNRLIMEDLNAVYNNGLIRIKINKSKVIPLYLYRQLQTKDFSQYIDRIEGETSTRPNMKMNYFLSYSFMCPPLSYQRELVETLNPMIHLQNKISEENRHLIQLRDTLLPKLMSGELDVSDIDL